MTEAVSVNSQEAYTVGTETGKENETEDENEDRTYSPVDELKALNVATAVSGCQPDQPLMLEALLRSVRKSLDQKRKAH